jgi:hypothetical protein
MAVKKLRLREDYDYDEDFYSDLKPVTPQILDDLKSDLYKAVADAMFEYRDFDISREVLDDIIRKNMDRFYDQNWM